MDIVVKGRKADVGERFRQHAVEKLSRVERLDHRIIRLDVEVSEERNPRQSDHRERVEVTCVSKGPVVRAEAAAADPYTALDLAIDKLQARLRRAADKKRIHHGRRTPDSLSSLPVNGEEPPAAAEPEEVEEPEEHGGVVVREKTFEGLPMTLDDALLGMELVGHDFYLYADSETGLPSVVYRRKGYDYGVIRLKT